ncbi:MAG: hypothetical protein ACXW1C_02470 [Gallionella sp.]
MSVLDYVEPLHVKEGKELQLFERQIFGAPVAKKEAAIDARIIELTYQVNALNANNAILTKNVNFWKMQALVASLVLLTNTLLNNPAIVSQLFGWLF